jgi:predicted TIM-barrel fold metal-dependent hydrolase
VGGHIGYPWTEEMISVSRKHENVFIDTSAYTPRRYPRELVSYMTSRGGRHKVLFGSNFPMLGHAQAVEGLEELGLDDDTHQLFLRGNAERLLRLAPGEAEAAATT